MPASKAGTEPPRALDVAGPLSPVWALSLSITSGGSCPFARSMRSIAIVASGSGRTAAVAWRFPRQFDHRGRSQRARLSIVTVAALRRPLCLALLLAYNSAIPYQRPDFATRLDVLSLARSPRQAFHHFQPFQLHLVSCRRRDRDGIVARVPGGTAGDLAPPRAEDRADYPGRRTSQPPGQARHADNGRAHHPARNHCSYVALGAADQSLRGRCDDLHPLDGMHWVRGRLSQDRAGEVAWTGGEVQAGRAMQLRAAAGAFSLSLSCSAGGYHSRNRHHASILQVPGGELLSVALRRV